MLGTSSFSTYANDPNATLCGPAQIYKEVEKAMNLKRKGAGPEVIFEEDLFDALSTFGFSH